MSQPPEDQTIAITQEQPNDSEALAAGSVNVAEDTGPVTVARVASPLLSPNIDRDAQEMVISSLRAQVQDLFSQVTELNGKLVQSYDRVSDLEDDLHSASSTMRANTLQISQLELERTQHLSALNTGLLVEKTHVTAELSRVMERATEEAARRGQAESARAEIEKDLDDLSASLFGQANNMVAQARFAAASSERKVEEAERALKGAEEAVTLMQHQMQAMQAEKERALLRVDDMQDMMGKGKWVDRERSPGLHAATRLLSLHAPYQEFLLFVAHLRSVRPTSQQPPVMSTLLQLPFLVRLQTEDSDPTLRLDLAPSLNWLSRRSVLAAIHTGELSIEPMASAAMVQELSFASYSTASLASSIIPGSSHTQNILCALCGTAIFPPEPRKSAKRPPLHPMISRTSSTSGSWSTSLFKNPLAQTNGAHSMPVSPTSTKPPAVDVASSAPTQVYVFRITVQTGSAPHSPGATPQRNPIYPLCGSGWCLDRLRSTCSLWSFIRNGVVERVWEEEVSSLIHAPSPKRPASRDSLRSLTTSSIPVPPEKQAAGTSSASAKPAVPPRRSKIGGLWGMASSALSAGVERVSSINVEPPKEKEKEKEKRLPQTPSRLPRAMPGSSPSRSPAARSPVPPSDGLSPPPLPKRSGVRRDNAGDSLTGIGAVASPAHDTNGHAANAGPVRSPPITVSSTFATPMEELDEYPISPPTAAAVTSPLPELHAPILLADNRTADVTQIPEAAQHSPELESSQPTAAPTTPPVDVSNPVERNTPSRTASPAPIAPSTPSRTSSPAPPRLPPRATSPAHQAPALPSRTSSPARQPPALPSRTSSPTPVTSSRSGSPAPIGPPPPPLPRRAAGRTRPLSMAAQAVANATAAAGGSTPTPPAPVSEAPIADGTSKGEVEAPPTTTGRIQSADPEPAPAEVTMPPAESEPPKVEPAESPLTDAAAAGPAESQPPNPAVPELEVPPATQITEPSAVVSPDTEVMATPPPVYSATPTAAKSGKNGPEQGQNIGLAPAVFKAADQKSSEEEMGLGVYVGDATWEERTWKELVRLRENMFWARIGGVR